MIHKVVRRSQKATEKLVCAGQLLGLIFQAFFGRESLAKQTSMGSPRNRLASSEIVPQFYSPFVPWVVSLPYDMFEKPT
jgi:hypothetical protein